MEDLIGKQLGAYRVEALLGEGGMAAVFTAYQPAMDRHVAIKILPRQMVGDTEFVARFQQEAKVVARLQHPHILPVFDYGEADGFAYLVMPLVMGGTLSGLMHGQPLPLSHIQIIVSQVGDALDYAHSQGVIHRDVKPGNVLLDERGNCLLTDFGLAKIMQGAPGLSGSGGIIGTPTYMSPEQGLGRPLDSRSDIYSLGVILYEMAVGRPPFSADTQIAIVVKHINEPFPPPRQLNASLPEPVERVILKALAKEPDDRYPTASAMVLDLRAALPDMLAAPPSLPNPTSSTPGNGAAASAVLAAGPQITPTGLTVADAAAASTPRPGISEDDVTPRWPPMIASTPRREPKERPASAKSDRALDERLLPTVGFRPVAPASRRRLWRFVLLTTLGWAAAPLVGNWLTPLVASRWPVDFNAVWLLAAGGFCGLWLGASLLAAGEVRMGAVPILALGLAGTLVGISLPRGTWTLGAVVLAGCVFGLVAHWVEPKLSASRAITVAGGWIVSLFLGGAVSGLTSSYSEALAESLAMAAAGLCCAMIFAWQLHQAARTPPPGEPAASPQPERPERKGGWLGRAGCLAWVVLALGIVGYRAYRVVIPASDCTHYLTFSYNATADQSIIPVVENDAIWLTSCGSQWSRPPVPLEVKLMDAQGNAVGTNVPCNSVWLQMTDCVSYSKLQPGPYTVEFLYNGRPLQPTVRLTIDSPPATSQP